MFSYKHSKGTLIVLFATLSLAALSASPAAAQEFTTYTYSAEQIPSLGGAVTWVYDINADGWVVGVSQTGDVDPDGKPVWHAFLYVPGVGTMDLNPDGAGQSIATGINDLGQVALEAQVESGSGTSAGWYLFRYTIDESGKVLHSEDLGWLDNKNEQFPMDCAVSVGINNFGDIAGWYWPVEYGLRSFLYMDDLGFFDIGTLKGDHAWAQAINKGTNGLVQVVGASSGAFRYTYKDGANDVWEDLGGLDDDLGGWPTHAYGVNDAGQVVGEVKVSKHFHPFRYTGEVGGDGKMEDLGTFGGKYAAAKGINNWGDVVGYATSKHSTLAFRYLDVLGMMEDLNCLIEPDPGGFFRTEQPLRRAWGINDAGQIIVEAPTETGWISYLLTPNEPTEAPSVSVSSITYATSGGKNQDRHLNVTVGLEDNLGSPVAGASVSIDVSLEGSSYTSKTGTTGDDGTVTFTLKNAPSGTYTTTVTDVDAGALPWDGISPPDDGFTK